MARGANEKIGGGSGGHQSGSGHCPGTLDSFNHGNGSQNFSNATINSGKNSSDLISTGASNQHQARTSGHETTRSWSHCSGTQSSFNCNGKGSQSFAGAIINSGENSGNRHSGRSSGASEQQHRVTGTRDSFNNYGSTKLRNRSGSTCLGNLRSCCLNSSQNFTGAKINSGENSGQG